MAQLPPKIPNMNPNWSHFPDNSNPLNVPSMTSLSPEPDNIVGTSAATTATTGHRNPAWVDEFLDFSAARRGAHRRSVSDSIAFMEAPMLEDCRISPGNIRPRSGVDQHHHENNNDDHEFERFDDEQLMSMFSDDIPGAAMPPPTFSSSNPSTPSENSVHNDDNKEISNHHHQQQHNNNLVLHQKDIHEREDHQNQQQQQQQQLKNESDEVGESEHETQAPNSNTFTTSSSDKITDPKRVKRYVL